MNAETTTFVVGFEEVPGSNAAKSSKKHNKHQNGKKGNEPTHLHLIDSANPDNNVRFTISQLWSYAEKMPAAFQRFLGVGYKGSPRRVINNLKKAKSFFTGESPVKSFPKKGVNPRVYEEVRVEVISSEEFDALFEEFDAEVSTEVDHDKYEDDAERDARQLELGIALFRKLLNSEERVKNLMKLFEGVMYGGANKKESLWTVYLGFMKFILCGVAEDYKGKTRNDDGSFDLDHPHLSFTALANAINEAKVNLTAKNTIATEEAPFHQRSPSNSSRKGSFHSQRRPSFHFHRSNSFNGAIPKKSPHDFASSLKWCLVIGLIEKTFTPALYEKLKATSGKPYVYSAHDIGTIIAPFNIEPLGEVPAKPESKKEKAAKAAAAAKSADKESSDEEDESEEQPPEAAVEDDEAEKPDEDEADEKADEEAVEDSDDDDSDDEEEEEEKPEPAAEAEAEEAEEDDDDDDDEDEKDEKDEEESEDEE